MLRLNTRVSGARTTGCRLDAHREDDTLHIDVELPGVDPAGIDVQADGDVLTLRVSRKPAGAEVTRQIALQECEDDLDTDRMDARYDEGVLTLTIPAKPAG